MNSALVSLAALIALSAAAADQQTASADAGSRQGWRGWLQYLTSDIFSKDAWSAPAAPKSALNPAIDGAAPGQWTMDLDAAARVAAEKKLPLMLAFTGSDWCGWCMHMEKEVFTKKAWGDYAKDHLRLVWLDFPENKALVPDKYVMRNQALAEAFRVEGYPTYIVLDDDGKTRLGVLGPSEETSPELFIDELDAVLQNRTAAVEAMLKTLPKKTVQEYRSAAEQKAAALAELQKLPPGPSPQADLLTKRIMEQDQRLDAIRLEARLAPLPKEKAAACRATYARLTAVTAELNAWLETRPDQSDANMLKYVTWTQEVAALKKELSRLLKEK